MVPEFIKKEAIRFLFPNLGESSNAYLEISSYIEENFEKLHCCSMYPLNDEFVRLVSRHHLDLSRKEVVINNGCLFVSSDYNKPLRLVIKNEPFYKEKKEELFSY